MSAELGFAAETIAPVELGGVPVSSTRIRAALQSGDFAGATRLLGQPYSIAGRVVRGLIRADRKVKGARALVMGLAFKENCPDLRNTRVVDIVAELESFGLDVDVCDPWSDSAEAQHEYGFGVVEPEAGAYDAIILAVAGVISPPDRALRVHPADGRVRHASAATDRCQSFARASCRAPTTP